MRSVITDGRPMQGFDRWLRHTPMTEPGALALEFEKLPSDIASLNRIAQGLLVHSEWLSAYGVDANTLRPTSRVTLPVSERLGELLKLDRRSLHVARAPANRSAGTCRDFALTLCSFLRATGTPARLRCGFAAYLAREWEDHWVCEYWDRQREDWRLSDPQLDEITCAQCSVSFDPSDMPRDVFLTGGDAWLRCRFGEQNPDRFGHGEVTGLWFIRVNVVRDAYAVNGRETSVWDAWREVPPELRRVSQEDLPHVDRLARRPESPPGDIMPTRFRL
jgi:Transglutaminase-like superfamily